MMVNGTLINYYFHCKRQCYLHGNRINLEDNSELVKIGKVLHDIKNKSDDSEVKIDNIAIDKITDKYIIEMKKSDADPVATKMQVLFYLKKLNEKGINKDGKIVYIEKNKTKTEKIIKLDYKNLSKIIECEKEIEELINSKVPPTAEKTSKCKKCAYHDYCFI